MLSANISTLDDTVVSSINGKTASDSNTLTAMNYLSGTVGHLRIVKKVSGKAAGNSKVLNLAVAFNVEQ